MDIEHLSKSQIILLTLLISFVTSIATGIVTVSLMDQAPPVIAQTVNRVIEHTVETVTPAASAKTGQAAATVVTQEKTVIVNENDLISKAVERANPSIVRMYTANADEPRFLGIGIVLDAEGMIVADSAALEDSDAVIARSDGTRVRAFVVERDKVNGFAFLRAATSSEGKAVSWAPAAISASQPVLGSTIVALSGKSVSRIAPGVVTAMLPGDGPSIVDTNIPTDSILSGSPIINTQGEVRGVSTGVSRSSSSQGFISASALIPAPTKK